MNEVQSVLNNRYFYYVLQGSSLLLADERNKKKFLDFLAEEQQVINLRVHAFCVTDESIHMVAECASAGILSWCMENVSARFMAACQEYLPVVNGNLPWLTEWENRELEDHSEIAMICRKIHLLPVEYGYTSQPMDYWWSSYLSYMGGYDWGMLDCNALLLYFSSNVETARTRMRRFHRKQSAA